MQWKKPEGFLALRHPTKERRFWGERLQLSRSRDQEQIPGARAKYEKGPSLLGHCESLCMCTSKWSLLLHFSCGLQWRAHDLSALTPQCSDKLPERPWLVQATQLIGGQPMEHCLSSVGPWGLADPRDGGHEQVLAASVLKEKVGKDSEDLGVLSYCLLCLKFPSPIPHPCPPLFIGHLCGIRSPPGDSSWTCRSAEQFWPGSS